MLQRNSPIQPTVDVGASELALSEIQVVEPTVAEVPVDLLQLLDEHEREVLALVRSAAEAARTKVLNQQQQPQQSTTASDLKAVLQEQSQWLKAVLERSSLGVATSAERRCCDLRRRGRHMRPIWGAASAAATSEASSAWPAGARPVEQYEDRPACFPLH
eukprot:Transcript_24185.p1 GENE.Transcript_24185~~Transcript_24185.p1  ORF type:complete len:160 (-),score=27.23 Transcript_24185:113-592(-)